MTVPELRRLVGDDAAALQRLQQEAFGVPTSERPLPDVERAGHRWWGSFDGDRLVASALDHEHEGWFGGRTVPVAGIGGVTVAAEARGAGTLGPLMVALLEGARERGAYASTLFPSAPGIYRRLGYEAFVGTRWVDVPSSALAAVRPVPGVVLRRASGDDAEAVRRLYDAWAAGADGPLTRRGVAFPADDAGLVGAVTGITLAEDAAGGLLGYASWVRGPGDADELALSVPDLLATRVDAYAALLRTLGSFASVAATVRLRTTGADLVRHLLPTVAWRVVGEDLYMLKVLDVAAMFAGMRCPPSLSTRLGLTVADDVLPGIGGGYLVEAAAGEVRCDRGPVPDDRTVQPRGLSLLVTGALPCRELRTLGLLAGGDPAQDPDWDALVSGRFRAVLDDF